MADPSPKYNEMTLRLLGQMRRNAEGQLLPAIRIYKPGHVFTADEIKKMQAAEIDLMYCVSGYDGKNSRVTKTLKDAMVAVAGA